MEVWQWKYVTGATTQLTNGLTFIKTVILWHSTTANAVIYNEKAGGTTSMFLTVYNNANQLTIPIIFENPCQLDAGCYIVLSAGGMLVQYKTV